jgi:hypothetical protein
VEAPAPCPATRAAQELSFSPAVTIATQMEDDMGLGKGALLWLIGIPIPIIILLMLFLR